MIILYIQLSCMLDFYACFEVICSVKVQHYWFLC